MKLTPFILGIAALFLLSSCGQDCKPVEDELRSARSALAKKDSTLALIGHTFHAIDSNILAMREVESELMGQMQARNRDKDAIRLNVEKLKNIMAMNQDYIKKLENNLGESSATSADLFSIIGSMEEKIAMNNLRLAHLNHDLGTMGEDFKGMFEEYMQAEVERMVLQENLQQMEGNINDMAQQMDELKSHLNTVYVAIGTKRELIESGVLEKGGLLKQGGMNENLNARAFTSYDLREIETLDFKSEKSKIITEHPPASYNLENGKLSIKSPKSFWSISKYLIVVVG